MNLTEDDIALMEDYLDKKLSDSDRIAFEARLQSDLMWAEEFNLFKLNYLGVVRESRKDLKLFLQEVEASTSVNPDQKPKTWLMWSIAAAAILAVAIVLIPIRSKTGALYEEYYTPYPNVVSAIERGTAIDSNIRNKAFQLYEDGSYVQAAMVFEELLKDQPDDPAVNLYAGLAELELNRIDSAKSFFTVVIDNYPNEYHLQARWYKALACLKDGDKGGARSILEELVKFDGPYQNRAVELLDKI